MQEKGFWYANKDAQRNIVFDQPGAYCLSMKLCQGQVWKQGNQYIRIVRLERLEVEYKSMASLTSREGTKHMTSKKDFCRLLKQAYLLRSAKPPNPLAAQVSKTTSP
jgi:hypothetical protein